MLRCLPRPMEAQRPQNSRSNSGVHAMDLRVMTFNIRNGIADDGTSSWQFRKHLLVRAVRAEMPDVLGLQEVFWHQRAFLWQALPEYEQFGEHRDGGREEEAALICYRHDRITLLEAGNLWLSETPEVAGSRDWGTHHARMASWARLCRRSDQARMLFINCHLDNQAEEARQHSALLLRDLATRKAEGDPVVLVGDFNTGPDTRSAGGRCGHGGTLPGCVAACRRRAGERTYLSWLDAEQ